MCDICDGASEDEVRSDFARKIETYGWAIQGVEGSPESVPWAYTVGLVEHFRHAELVVTSIDFRDACFILNRLSEAIQSGRRFAPGVGTQLGGLQIDFVTVHPAHFARGVFASWFEQYRSFGVDGPQLSALQVILPDGLFCAHHARTRPRLDEPAPALGIARLNRAGRRAVERRRRCGRRPTG